MASNCVKNAGLPLSSGKVTSYLALGNRFTGPIIGTQDVSHPWYSAIIDLPEGVEK